MATRADGSILIDITADPKKALNGIQSVEKGVNGLASTAKKLTGILVAAFAVDKIVQFGKEAIELGSDVAEVQNVVDVAFGDMAYMVEDFADTAITSFGMSELAAKRTASTYMAMASNMGVTQQQAAEMAITLAGLTGDVASFYNISQELADIKLRSVFTGETETLKDLGIVMTQANLEAYALANGINRSFQSMSQSEQLILRYNYVLDQLSLASGDFVRTQDSWANQTRILSMQWQEFMSIIGQALIQVLLPVVQTLNKIVSALIDMANALNAALTSLFGGTSKQIQQTQSDVSGVSSGIGDAVENQDALTDATKETNQAQKKSLSNFDQINKLSTETANASSDKENGGSIGMAGGPSTSPPSIIEQEVSFSAPDANPLLGIFESLQKAIQPTIDALGRLWEQLQRVGSFSGQALIDFYNQFLVPVGGWILGEGLPRLIDALAEGLALVDWERINGALSKLWDALAPFAIHVGEGLLWFWENVMVPIGTWVLNNAVPIFLENLASILDILNAAIEMAKPALQWLWDNFLQPIAQFVGDMLLSTMREFHGWLNLIAGLLTGDFDRAIEGAREILDSWGDRFTAVKNLAIEMWNGIKETFKVIGGWIEENVIGPVLSAFTGLWDGVRGAANAAWANIKETYVLVEGWFSDNVISPVTTAFSNLWSGIKQAAGDAWSDIKDAFDGASGWFEDNVTTPISDGFKSFVNGLIGFIESFANSFIRGLNKVISAVNTLSFTVPDWVPEIGGSTFGFDIQPINELSLPRLARGAVIPPNREFLAVLGDQRSGYNYEVPDDKLRQLIREETAGLREAKEIRLVVTAGDSLVRELKIRLDRESQRQGVSLVKGGVL